MLYLSENTPIVAKPVVNKQWIRRVNTNRSSLFMTYKLKAHFLKMNQSPKQDWYGRHHRCAKRNKSMMTIYHSVDGEEWVY